MDLVTHTVKKGYRFPRPQAGMSLTKIPWPGIIKLFPARESLVSDIPAEDGKKITFFTVQDVEISQRTSLFLANICFCNLLSPKDPSVKTKEQVNIIYVLYTLYRP